MADAVDIEVMDLGVESVAHLAGIAGKIDDRGTRSDGVDDEPMDLEPACDRLQVRGRQAEIEPELLRAEPLVELWRGGIVELVNQLLQRLLPLG
jgi:hypothetical protein